jgi:4-amino-4-deoxy-L-arabinose transferase-like glycosyltransferase
MFDITVILLWIKKHFGKKDVVIFVLLGILFLATRIIRLDQFPIFSDEGIYIHWARIAWKDASWRFVSLTDGRQPLQTWGTIPLIKLFPDNVLLAGRLFSVATGFSTLIGLFILLWYSFNKRTAIIGSLLYIFIPYFMFYDRMALVDSAVNSGCIWILFFSLLLIKTTRIDVALIFGLFAGVFLLAKSSVRLFLGLSSLAPILIIQWKNKKSIMKTVNYFILLCLAVTISIVLYNIQRLSPFFHFVSQKNLTFVMSFQEFMQNPFALFIGNMKQIPIFVFWELGFVIVPFAFIGMYMMAKKNIRLFFYLILWILIPYVTISFFSKVLFPRYVLFLGMMITIFSAYCLANIKSQKIFLVSIGVILIFALYFDYAILIHPPSLNFPPIDRGQYITGRTAGWGAKDIIAFAREKSKIKRVLILAEGDFGLSKDVLEAFIQDKDNIFLKGYWPLEEKQLKENQKELKDAYVFVVFANTSKFPAYWPIKLIKRYDKPDSFDYSSSLYLFELTP